MSGAFAIYKPSLVRVGWPGEARSDMEVVVDEIVFALSDCTLMHTETKMKVRLTAGEAWWASDPLVKARPEFFGSMPSVIHGQRQVRTVLAPVEQATAAPGVKRSVKKS